MTFFVSVTALIVGIFIVAWPARAARIWGWKHFDEMSPRDRTTYLRSYRGMGIVVGLAAVMAALDTALFH
jgi:hypothetical protein